MTATISPRNDFYLTSSNTDVTFTVSATGGSGQYTRSNWDVTRTGSVSYIRTLNTNAASHTFYTHGVEDNGNYEFGIDVIDARTGQKIALSVQVVVNHSSGGGGDGPGRQ